MRDWGWLYDLCNNIKRRFNNVDEVFGLHKERIGAVEARVEALEGGLQAALALVHEMKGKLDAVLALQGVSPQRRRQIKQERD